MRTPQPHRAPNHSPGPTHSRFEAGRRRLPAADRFVGRLRPRRSPVPPGSPYRLRPGDSPRFVRLCPFHTPVESISARCTTLFFKPSNHLTGSRQKTVHPASFLNLLGSFYPPSSFFLLPFTLCPSPPPISLQFKFNRDRGDHAHRLVIHQRGLVTPLSHRFSGRLPQEVRTRNHLYILDIPVLGDDSAQERECPGCKGDFGSVPPGHSRPWR